MQVSQEIAKIAWYSHLFKRFPQFVMIHTVKGFSVVNETEVDFFWSFAWRIFENYLASMWNEYNCMIVWTFFGITFLWDWNENWPFPVLWPLLNFPDLLAYWVQHFNSIPPKKGLFQHALALRTTVVSAPDPAAGHCQPILHQRLTGNERTSFYSALLYTS